MLRKVNWMVRGVRGQLVALAIIGLIPLAGQANIKIGYIDMQKALQSTSGGKTAKSNLEKEFKKKKKELEKRESDLKKMREDLEKKSLVLSDDVRTKKERALQQEMLKYGELVRKSNMEMQKKERDLTLPILKKLREIIGDIAGKEKYTMILEKSEQSVLWASKEIDLTDRVVASYEKTKKKKK